MAGEAPDGLPQEASLADPAPFARDRGWTPKSYSGTGSVLRIMWRMCLAREAPT